MALRSAKWCVVLGLCVALCSAGCERKPEDLEKWRKAEGGTEKMIEWATSKQESLAVRQRALVILLEDGEGIKLPELLDKEKDEATRAQLASGLVGPIEQMWAVQDIPTIDEATKAGGGQVQVKDDAKAVLAKDAAYYLHPYVKGEEQQRLEKIIGEWMSRDHILRNQVGKTTLAQLLPRAGAAGMDGMMAWFTDEKRNPNAIAQAIRQQGDDATKERFAQQVAKMAQAQHPELTPAMRTVVLETEHPAIVPYLEVAIQDDRSAPELVDDAMDAYLRIQGVKASNFLTRLVAEKRGLARWVSAVRLIELRQDAGAIQAANALPLELDSYETEAGAFEKEAKIFCNYVLGELVEAQKRKDEAYAKQDKAAQTKAMLPKAQEVTGKLLGLPRWPAQAIGLQCARQYSFAALKPQVEGLKGNKQAVPGWEGATSVGELAAQVASEL